MLFSENTNFHKNLYKEIKKVYSPGIKARSRKRVFYITSKLKASLSLEAIIGLFVTMMVTLSIASIITIINTQHYVQANLDNVARRMSQDFYYVETVEGVVKNIDEVHKIIEELKNFDLPIIDENALLKLTGDFVFYNYAKSEFVKEIGEEYLSDTYIVGGSLGLDFSKTRYDRENSTIDLVLTYQLKIPFIDDSVWQIEDTRRSYVKIWTGKNITKSKKYVYVTKRGEVYHLNEKCPHLNLGITKEIYSDVSSLRNNVGEKYKNCETCGYKKYGNNDFVYITNTGNKYHTSLSCTGLTRNVMRVDISQVDGKSECKTCGNKEGNE